MKPGENMISNVSWHKPVGFAMDREQGSFPGGKHCM